MVRSTGISCPGWSRDARRSLVFDPNAADGPPKYFMLLGWDGDKVATIRNFRYASYIIEGVEYCI